MNSAVCEEKTHTVCGLSEERERMKIIGKIHEKELDKVKM